ncbi:hypothetical protein [Longimicrobium sp.]|uniref:hypothetical protein n=1 Tax=Longimicrobium sp. TaxID=2029185 RepID=UPI002E33A7A1|nr:hypothetical protein [Longimicrobium sp.]HEX6040212.1 hypothetical protein [Longimicrobium sp.]
MIDYGSLFATFETLVRASDSAETGWMALLAETERHGAVPPELRAWDVAAEVAQLRAKVEEVIRGAPLPPGTKFIWFGLFDARDEETDLPVAGFYLGGGPDENAELAIAEGRLEYLPESRYLISPLLDAIEAAAERDEYDYRLMNYALVFGAAALLARHATEGLLDGYSLVVGFDEGDYATIRPAQTER